MQTYEKFNIGLALLRMLMCFVVILNHFWIRDNVPALLMPFLWMDHIAVPVFMLMSFYLTEKSFLSRDIQVLKKRLWRVAWPLVGWTIIYYVVYKSLDVVLKLNIGKEPIDLVWQLFTGHSIDFNESMWYQTVLLALTLLFFLIFFKLKEKVALFVIGALTCVALILQYSGLNYKLFNGLRYELQYPLGRFTEMIPYAVIGFASAYYGISDKAKKNGGGGTYFAAA